MNKKYNIKYDAVLKNRLTNEVVNIDGKLYWVVMSADRGQAQLSYSKDSWILTKGK
jgi:hypothetical protein